MTVLVTAGAGYIGFHVVKELLAAGTPVVVLDYLRTGHRAAVPADLLVEGNCGDPALVWRFDTAHRVTGRAITVEVGPRREGDPAVLVASAARIRGGLGWRPQYGNLETIIASAWKWHPGNPVGYSAL